MPLLEPGKRYLFQVLGSSTIDAAYVAEYLEAVDGVVHLRNARSLDLTKCISDLTEKGAEDKVIPIEKIAFYPVKVA